jgi:hypothetical protein
MIMMEWMHKETPYNFELLDQPKSYIIRPGAHDLEKIASMGTHIPEKLANAIRAIEAAPDPNMVYMYDRALGAYESYGPNNNGDGFDRAELIEHHPSFVKHARLYRHHQNKDPNNGIGDVLESDYNYPLDTVDLIIRAPLSKVASDIQKLDNGDVLATSMGAKVPYDVCSYCGNQARTRAMYCSHLRTMMLKVINDRQVYAKNPKPRFVDISMVVIPAAPESGVIRKIASLISKVSEIKKTSPSLGSDGESRPVVRPEVINAVGAMDIPSALLTLDSVYGPLRPDEFQAVLRKDASCLRPDMIPFVYVEPTETQYLSGMPNPKLAFLLSKVPGQELEKTAQLKIADFLDAFEKSAYLHYRKHHLPYNRNFLR